MIVWGCLTKCWCSLIGYSFDIDSKRCTFYSDAYELNSSGIPFESINKRTCMTQVNIFAGRQELLQSTFESRWLSWFGHVCLHDMLPKINYKEQWKDNIKEWTCQSISSLLLIAVTEVSGQSSQQMHLLKYPMMPGHLLINTAGYFIVQGPSDFNHPTVDVLFL